MPSIQDSKQVIDIQFVNNDIKSNFSNDGTSRRTQCKQFIQRRLRRKIIVKRTKFTCLSKRLQWLKQFQTKCEQLKMALQTQFWYRCQRHRIYCPDQLQAKRELLKHDIAIISKVDELVYKVHVEIDEMSTELISLENEIGSCLRRLRMSSTINGLRA